MPENAAKELVTFLEDQAGEYLRGVMHYAGDEYRILHLREDVSTVYSEEDLDELRAHYRRTNETRGDKPFSLGNKHCTVDFYDEAILFHFMQRDDVGTVVTLDPEAGRDIVTFITRCLAHFHQHTPESIDVPTWLKG